MEKSTNANKKRSWTAVYLHGSQTYIEIFPHKYDLPQIGIAFSVEKSGQAHGVHQVLSEVNPATPDPTLKYFKDNSGKLIPWFYTIPILEEDEKQTVWFMEVHPKVLTYAFKEKSGDETYDETSIDRKTYQSKLYNPKLMLRDVSYIKAEFDSKAINKLNKRLVAMGFKLDEKKHLYSNDETKLELVTSPNPRGLLELGFIVEGGKKGTRLSLADTSLFFEESNFLRWTLQK